MPSFPQGPPGSIYPPETWQGPLARFQNIRNTDTVNDQDYPESFAVVEQDAD